MKLLLVALYFATSNVCSVDSDRIFPFTSDSEDSDLYSSYQLSPIFPVRKPTVSYQPMRASDNNHLATSTNQARATGRFTHLTVRDSYREPSNSYRSHRVNSTPRNLQASPSMVSASAAMPFLFYRNSPSYVKKVSKKVSATREKATHSPPVPKSQDTVDWSAEDMMQHPIDEAPRKSNRALGLPCSYSSDCGSGCCLLDRKTKLRSCQPLARMGDTCTKSQVKGDLYVDACPCMRGADLCSTNNRCSW